MRMTEKSNYTRCAVCGAVTRTSKDKNGEVYAIQLCSNVECFKEAWKVVCAAIKRGRKPRIEPLPPEPQNGRKHTTAEIRAKMIKMHKDGIAIKDIVKETGFSNVTCMKVVRRGY
ncbi:MAG: hypothetical protein LIO53_02080 [Oscillospiraceae bacterium]|nr:hypothetical protein [Oscillospiraceae bacterium]